MITTKANSIKAKLCNATSKNNETQLTKIAK